jgi:hypothetical protein
MQIAKLVMVNPKPSILLAIISLVVFAWACRVSPPSSRPADSAYATNLKKYLRDSSVIDSLSRLVRTDSLRALYRVALLPAGASEKLVEQVWCEQGRLTLMHGYAPAQVAINRLLDTVYLDRGIRGRDAAFGYFAARAPSSGGYDSRACGKPPPRAPSSIAGTPIDELPRRP